MSLDAPDWSRIPALVGDGAACHLLCQKPPSTPLPATNKRAVDLSALAGPTVVYAYSRTGRPGIAKPDDWDDVPVARWCTPRSRAFRDHAGALKVLRVQQLFGLSTQDTAYQAEAATLLRLPLSLLSDTALLLTRTLDLPNMEIADVALLHRLRLIVDDRVITHLFYPVFSPDRSEGDVLEWLRAGPGIEPAGHEVGHPAHGPLVFPRILDASS